MEHDAHKPLKVVIMADSLALPRQAGEGDIRYEATYPFLLECALRSRLGASAPVIIERGMRRRTIEYVLDEWHELVELRAPDVVIIHVGIVDCAPRIFLRRERAFVERMRPARLRKFILDFAHKHRRGIIEKRPRVYVPLERFKNLVEQVIERARASHLRSLIFVNIITPPDAMETRSPGFQRNVEKYNQTLRAHANEEWIHLIDLNGLLQEQGGIEKLTVDGIHINEAGHEILAQELEQHLLEACEDVRVVDVQSSKVEI